MRDHEPITLRDFLGTFDRGDDDSVPAGYFKDSRNVRFFSKGVASREGTSLAVTISSVKRMAVYKRIGEAQRLLILNAAGQLYDSTNLSTPILYIAAMSDFSMETMFNRAYITPHNGITGLAGEKVYVYEGSGVARPAGGSAPSGFTLTLEDSTESGSSDTGVHAFGVCFETVSGHLTAPGGFAQLDRDEGKKVDISNIPLGDSSVVARQIVATKRIVDFNGDFVNQEYFIVPNGRIPDNTTTTLTIGFYDADLMDSADYLFDQLSEIPAGVGLINYKGHLVVWGENANPSIARVSKVGYPESHDAVEGYLTVNPGDSGGGILNAAEYRTQLLFMKDERTYATQDNGENAAYWDAPNVDSSIGSSCHGIATVRDFGDNTQDRLIVASRQGIQIFIGTYSNAAITYNVDGIWGRINEAYFHTIEVVVDPKAALVFCAIPLDAATSPNYLLVMDYQDGWDKAKFTLWSFPRNPTTIVVDVDNTTKASIFKFGALNGNVYKLDTSATDDFGTAIGPYIQFSHLPGEEEGMIFHFTGIRVRARGTGTLDVRVEGLDVTQSLNAQGIVISSSPGKEYFRGFNFVNERASVKLGMDGAGESFRLTKFVLFLAVEWETRPE